MRLYLDLETPEDIGPAQIEKYKEIFQVLLDKGALDGVRGGSAVIHFDGQGVFQGLQLDYWPFRKRK